MARYICAYCEKEFESDYGRWPLCEACHRLYLGWFPRNCSTRLTYHYEVACLLLQDKKPAHYIDQILSEMETFVPLCADGNDHYDIGEIYLRRERYTEALDHLEKSYDCFLSEYSTNPEPETVLVMAELQLKMSTALCSLGRQPEAHRKLEESIRLYHNGYELAHEHAKRDITRTPLLGEACIALAEAYHMSGDMNKALGYYQKARAAFRVASGMDHSQYCRLITVDTVLIKLLMDKEEPLSQITKYIIERLQTEINEIRQRFPKIRTK